MAGGVLGGGFGLATGLVVALFPFAAIGGGLLAATIAGISRPSSHEPITWASSPGWLKFVGVCRTVDHCDRQVRWRHITDLLHPPPRRQERVARADHGERAHRRTQDESCSSMRVRSASTSGSASS